MNPKTLQSYLKVRGWSQSQLAKACGISRQSVSLWLQSDDPVINLQMKCAQKIALALNVSIDDLSKPLLLNENAVDKKKIETELLWDSLYDDLESFVSGLIRNQHQALARFVQVYGFFKAEKAIGKRAWQDFHLYKKLIHPAYRKSLEAVWAEQKKLNLI
jgi:transcriptional regulator with XRE-family HTH domain